MAAGRVLHFDAIRGYEFVSVVEEVQPGDAVSRNGFSLGIPLVYRHGIQGEKPLRLPA